MRKYVLISGVFFGLLLIVSAGWSAYHHEGEQDADKFLIVYPGTFGTKLDHCALCHSGGEYEKKPGQFVSLGSCQWCHHSYGYDGSGNIIDTLNSYGMDYLVNGRDEQAISAIESLDSDGDGYDNISEINALRYPGNANDDPTKVPAPCRVYTRAQLEALTSHTQFMLMNTSRSGDFYAQYTGVPMETLLEDAGMLTSATGITVYAPDGWSNYHPLEIDHDAELYHVNGLYPDSVYYYDEQADIDLNSVDGWCDYSAPSCQGRTHLDLLGNAHGLKMILAYKREGSNLEPGILNQDNKLDGEGPYRVVPPQKNPGPPDQSSKADNQDVIWPYTYDWDHNAGAASRSATIIKVEPLPAGTTDIDILEAGWSYVDEEKIIIYGAITSRCGDFDGDGVVDMNDLTESRAYMVQYYQDWMTCCYTPQLLECGDCNGDGVVDSTDSNWIRVYLDWSFRYWGRYCLVPELTSVGTMESFDIKAAVPALGPNQ
ncbi:MAG: GEGP motif-containing diheme protein [Thermodesulfobacteriota bacterium]|nr:GEGP motif-containing diheme protein [Thermodesulfobacteriota bacterium]